MKNNNLSKAIPIRLTKVQEKALNKLSECGINRSYFIRDAIQMKLESDYRQLINDYNRFRARNNQPNWL